MGYRGERGEERWRAAKEHENSPQGLCFLKIGGLSGGGREGEWADAMKRKGHIKNCGHYGSEERNGVRNN